MTETIYEEQEPPDFEGSSLALSPTQSPDGGDSSEAPIIRLQFVIKEVGVRETISTYILAYGV